MSNRDRDTLKQCAERLGVTETAAVHIAINRLFAQIFPERISDDAPTDAQISEINSRNATTASDPVVRKASLADILA